VRPAIFAVISCPFSANERRNSAPKGLDHRDLRLDDGRRLRARREQRDVLGPDAERCLHPRRACDPMSCAYRQRCAGRDDVFRIPRHLCRDHVHRGAADEARHEQVGRRA
jgi:hypothetical protein